MATSNGMDDARTIRSDEGTWVFVAQEPLTFGDEHAWSALLMVRTPNGRIIDLYLPLGIDPNDVTDTELVDRARRVLRRAAR